MDPPRPEEAEHSPKAHGSTRSRSFVVVRSPQGASDWRCPTKELASTRAQAVPLLAAG